MVTVFTIPEDYTSGSHVLPPLEPPIPDRAPPGTDPEVPTRADWALYSSKATGIGVVGI